MVQKLCALLFALTLAACGSGGGGETGSGGTGGGSGLSGGGFNGGVAGTPGTPPQDPNVVGYAFVTNTGSDNVSAYTINGDTGALSEVSGSPFATGSGPNALAVDNVGRFVYVTNAGSFDFNDTVSTFAINGATGALTNVGTAPAGRSDLRSIAIAGNFVYTASGGSRTSSFEIDGFVIGADGSLAVNAGNPFEAGTNPAAIACEPTLGVVYVANQASHDVSIFNIDFSNGGLVPSVNRALVPGAPQWATVHPSGHFLYVDGSAFNIIEQGELAEMAGSPFFPEGSASMAVDPSGRFAYASTANGIAAFNVDAENGALSEVAGSPFSAAGASGSIAVDRTGHFVYLAGGGGIHGYAIDNATGALTEINGSPLPSAGTSIATGPLQ